MACSAPALLTLLVRHIGAYFQEHQYAGEFFRFFHGRFCMDGAWWCWECPPILADNVPKSRSEMQ